MRQFRRERPRGGGWCWRRRPDLRALLLVAAVALLGGCAEKWAKPGAGEPEFRAMAAQCESYAASRWPPLLREQVMFPGYWTAPVRSCGPHGRCFIYPGYFVPPQTMVVDDNLGARSQDRRACFVANGWAPVEE